MQILTREDNLLNWLLQPQVKRMTPFLDTPKNLARLISLPAVMHPRHNQKVIAHQHNTSNNLSWARVMTPTFSRITRSRWEIFQAHTKCRLSKILSKSLRPKQTSLHKTQKLRKTSMTQCRNSQKSLKRKQRPKICSNVTSKCLKHCSRNWIWIQTLIWLIAARI